MKKLSVIIPIYNAEKYLHRCIKSILNQTYTNIEIILVNDGSKDNSAKICEEYAKKNKNIIYVSKQNEGPGPARNKGIEIATGDFIGFVDSDDFIYKEMYFEMLREAVKNDADVVQCGYFKADEMGNILNEKSFTDKVLYIEDQLLNVNR